MYSPRTMKEGPLTIHVHTAGAMRVPSNDSRIHRGRYEKAL